MQRFLEDARAGRVPANEAAIREALARIGELLPQPETDPTEPEGFNEWWPRVKTAELPEVSQ